MIEYVKFGNLDSVTDLGLELETVDIQSPQVKTYIVDLPSGHGSLDFTEAFGEIYYGNRVATFQFHYFQTDYNETVVEKAQQIVSMVHGKAFTIEVDGEYDFVLEGRTEVFAAHVGRYLEVTITADCKPFWRAKALTVRSFDIGVAQVEDISILYGGDKVVFPEVFASVNGLRVKQGAVEIVLPVSTWVRLSDFGLKKGGNDFTLTGSGAESGSVTFRYEVSKL